LVLMQEIAATRFGGWRWSLVAAACGAGWIVAAVFLWRTSVPSLDLDGFDPRRYFSPRALKRSHDYERGVQLLWLLATIAEIVALLVLVRVLPRSVRGIGLGRVSTAVVVGMVVLTTLSLVALPFGIAELWWQHHWGLGPFDIASWLVARRFEIAASAIVALATIAIVVALATRFPRGWWVPGAAAFVVLVSLLTFFSGWLAALGSDPLRRASLRQDVARIERAEGVSAPVRVQKVSDWTNQANAFASGFGPSTNVVLWDTLLDGRFSRDEVDIVIAHELAHVKSEHIAKGLAWFALFAFPAMFAIAWVTGRRGGMRNPANLPLAVLVLTLVSLAAAPLFNAVTRRYEAEADWRALRATDDPNAAIGLFRQFQQTSLQEPNPSLLAYLWLETHPTLMQRVAMAERYGERSG
jgi:STE24 endopeptidase